MKLKFHVPDMSCGHCRATIEKVFAEADPLAELTFDMEARHVSIDSDLREEEMTRLLKEAGYPATAVL